MLFVEVSRYFYGSTVWEPLLSISFWHSMIISEDCSFFIMLKVGCLQWWKNCSYDNSYLENIVENLKAAHNLFTSCYVSYKIANSTWGLSPWQWWWFGHHHVHVVVVVIQQRGVWLDVTWAQTSCWTLQQQLLLLNSINNNAINCHYFKLILKTDKLLCFKVVCPLGRYAGVGRKSNLLRGICSCYKLFQWTLIEIAAAPFLREISNIEWAGVINRFNSVLEEVKSGTENNGCDRKSD